MGRNKRHLLADSIFARNFHLFFMTARHFLKQDGYKMQMYNAHAFREDGKLTKKNTEEEKVKR